MIAGYVIRVATYRYVAQLVISWHNFSRELIGSCEGYTRVFTQVESVHQISVCAKKLCLYCYISNLRSAQNELRVN